MPMTSLATSRPPIVLLLQEDGGPDSPEPSAGMIIRSTPTDQRRLGREDPPGGECSSVAPTHVEGGQQSRRRVEQGTLAPANSIDDNKIAASCFQDDR